MKFGVLAAVHRHQVQILALSVHETHLLSELHTRFAAVICKNLDFVPRPLYPGHHQYNQYVHHFHHLHSLTLH